MNRAVSSNFSQGTPKMATMIALSGLIGYSMLLSAAWFTCFLYRFFFCIIQPTDESTEFLNLKILKFNSSLGI